MIGAMRPHMDDYTNFYSILYKFIHKLTISSTLMNFGDIMAIPSTQVYGIIADILCSIFQNRKSLAHSQIKNH